MDSFRLTRKIGFGLRPDEDVPTDVVEWATAQLDRVPVQMGVAEVPSVRKRPKELLKPQPWPAERVRDLEAIVASSVAYKKAEVAALKFEGDGERWGEAMSDARQKYYGIPWDALRRSHQPVYSSQPVFERFSYFWANHFTVSASNWAEWVFPHFFDEAIGKNLTRDFASLLYDVTTHPGMQVFLDGPYSIGPKSRLGKELRSEGVQADINENLGRELLELHSLSPAAGYTQDDIIGVARILTGHGYTIELPDDFPSKERWKVFFKDRHEPGNKVVMGVTYPEGSDALRQLTDFLAHHQATILHVSAKLAKHFVADEPSTADIDFIARRWRETDGDMRSIHRAVIERAVARAEARKFQMPEVWLYQMLRSSGANLFNGWDQTTWEFNESPFDSLPREPIRMLQELGQSYWTVRQPNGYSDDRLDWISPEHLDRRVRFSQLAFKAGMPWLGAEDLLDRMQADGATRALVAQVKSPDDKFALLFCSPEMMEA